MGGAQSVARNEVIIDVSTALSYMSSVIQQNSQTISQTSTRANNFELVGDGATVRFKGKFTLNQTINAVNQATGRIESTVTQKMSVDLQSMLSAAVDQAASAKAGAFATADTRTTNISKTKNALSAAITDIVQDTKYQSLAQDVVDVNNGRLVLKNGTYIFDDSFTVDQKFFSNVIANTVMSSIIDKTNQILMSNNTDLKVKQKATSESKGLLSFLENPWFITGSIVSCCVILIVVVLLFVVYSKEKKKAGGA